MTTRPLDALPANWATTRTELQRVAAHVLARRRADLVGKIGLRASPGGFATPAAGPEHEVVRVSGSLLVCERQGSAARTAVLDLAAATLEEAAAFVGVDLDAPLDLGHDAPPLGDRGARLAVDPAAADVLARWFALGWAVLDPVVSAAVEPSVIQLWPEHFDAGADVVAGSSRVNLGASPGDGFHDEPYLYVGPWEPDRPGDGSYWNAPFGAVLTHAELRASPDPVRAGIQFLRHGLALLTT